MTGVPEVVSASVEAIRVDPLSPSECAVVQEAIKQLGAIACSLIEATAHRWGDEKVALIEKLASRILARHEVLAAFERPGGAA